MLREQIRRKKQRLKALLLIGLVVVFSINVNLIYELKRLIVNRNYSRLFLHQNQICGYGVGLEDNWKR
jgi:hypothetical protein